MFDRMLGTAHRRAGTSRRARLLGEAEAIAEVARNHLILGRALVEAQRDGVALSKAVEGSLGWDRLSASLEVAAEALGTDEGDGLDELIGRHASLRKAAAVLFDVESVFALFHLVGYRFAPRIRDLGDRRLFVIDRHADYGRLDAMIGGTAALGLVEENWDDWLMDLELRRRSHGNLNKGESRHALARAVFFHRLGELRDRTAEAMAYRASGLNLVVNAIILWNTTYLARAIRYVRGRGVALTDERLSRVALVKWDHIALTGD